jgi:predicted transcriptional regulator
MSKQFSWAASPLALEEQKLVSAYETRGKPLDLLPYSEEFDEIIRDLEMEPTEENKRLVFHRLLNLRKTARLPRTSNVIGTIGELVPLSSGDQELLAAYDRIGRPVDALPYTTEFDQLINELGKPRTPAIQQAVFQSLLQLRKRGRLPSLFRPGPKVND